MNAFYKIFLLLLLPYCIQAQGSFEQYNLSQLDSLWEINDKDENFPVLLKIAQATLAKTEQLNGKKDSLNACALYRMAYVYDYGEGNLEEAMKLYQQALESFPASDTISALYARILANIADIYGYNYGDYTNAGTHYSRAVFIVKKIRGAEHPEYADYLNIFATNYYNEGNFSRALQLFTQVKEIRAKSLGKDSPEYAVVLNNLGIIYKEMGFYDKAEALYIEAKNIRAKNGKESNEYANSLNNLASLYWIMEAFEQAELLLQEAIEIDRKTLGETHSDYGTSLNNLAKLYKSTKNYAQAEQLALKVIDIWKKNFGENHPDIALATTNLADLYAGMDSFDKAETHFKRALKLYAKTLGKDHILYCNPLMGLATIYLKMSKYVEAEQLLVESRPIIQKVLGTQHLDFALLCNNLSSVYFKMGDKNKSWEQVQLALKCSAGLTMSNSITPLWADSLASVSYTSNKHIETTLKILDLVYEMLDKPEQKSIIADLSNDLLHQIRSSFVSDKDKLRILQKSHVWLTRNFTVLNLNTQADKAFELAEFNKAVLLLESTKSEKAYQMGKLPDSLAQKQKALLHSYTDLEAKLQEKIPEEEKNSLRPQLAEISEQLKVLKAEITSQYPQYANLNFQDQNLRTADVQALLDSETALLEYVVTDSLVYWFCLDKTNLKMGALPLPHNDLKNYVKKLHTALSDYNTINNNPQQAFSNYTSVAYWFYQKLVAPLALPPTIKHLIIIPDGELSHLPFETFLTQPAPTEISYAHLDYLIKTYNISYHYSAMLWKESRDAAPKENNRQLFALAADYPSLTATTPSNAQSLTQYQRIRQSLAPLASAKREVEVLQEIFSGYFAFGTNANERFFKANAPQYGIIHLAMHGLLDRKNPILSSLAFTENGDSSENDFLQAYEISKMELNADLVVLSACETGYGKFEQGNGTASLARAFMYAGVPALVVSLWEVNDASTAQIMQFFYDNLANGQDKAEALRQAKLQYLSKAKGMGAHPAYWSAFVQMGDSRPITLSTKRNSYLKWIVMGAGVLVLGAGLLLRRRYGK